MEISLSKRAQVPIGMPLIMDKQLSKLIGPYRVFPGRLSVSRTIGDAEAKLPKYGGNPKVVIAVPDVYTIELGPEHNFIFIGCDGIFDRLSNEDINEIGWSVFEKPAEIESLHKLCGDVTEQIIRAALAKKTLDNVTCVIIAFEAMQNFLENSNIGKPLTSQFNTVDLAQSSSHIQQLSLATTRLTIPATQKIVVGTPRATNDHNQNELAPLITRKLAKHVANQPSAPNINVQTQKTFDQNTKKGNIIPAVKGTASFMMQTFHNGVTLRPISKKLIPTVMIRKKHPA